MSSDLIDIKKINIDNPAEVMDAVDFIIEYDLFVEAYLLIKRLGIPPLTPPYKGVGFSEPLLTKSLPPHQIIGVSGLPRGIQESAPLLTKEGVGSAPLLTKEGLGSSPLLTKEGLASAPLLTKEGLGEVLNKLKWVALPKLKEEEIVKMFLESFTTIFELPDYDLLGKIKQKIINDIWYEDRDKFKKEIGKALLKNTEYLTENNIIVNGKEESPTVSNWLKDYNVNLGFAPVDAAKQSEYLTNSGNMKKLVSSIKYQVSSEGERESSTIKVSSLKKDQSLNEKFQIHSASSEPAPSLSRGQALKKDQSSKFREGEGDAGFPPLQRGVRPACTDRGDFSKVGTGEMKNGEMAEDIEFAKRVQQPFSVGTIEPSTQAGQSSKLFNEKDKLRILFNFYEKLKLSSLTAEGLEEDIYIDEEDMRGVLSGGVFTKIDPKLEEKISELQKIIDKVYAKTRGETTHPQPLSRGEEGAQDADSDADLTRKNKELHPASLPWEEGEVGESSTIKVSSLKKDQISNNKEQKTGNVGARCFAPSNEEEVRGESSTIKVSSLKLNEQAKKAYVFSLDEQKIIKDNEEDIKRSARGNIILVGKELTKALEQKNRPRVIATLRIAVKNNLLLGWAEKGYKTDGHGLETDKHGMRIAQSVISENPSAIRENLFKEQGKDTKLYLINFLRKVLQDKLGLNENEAAKIGVHIYNLFRKLGRDVGYLAYYDEKLQKFCWMEEY